jgi:hypothetical protein
VSDLATWLLDRIAEDEAVARAARQGTWRDTGTVLAGVIAVESYDTVAVCNSSEWGGGEYSYPATAEEAASASHIARHDPARVLAECAAKRRIVDEHAGGGGSICSVCADGMWNLERASLPCDTLRILALPYAACDGYDPAWRP